MPIVKNILFTILGFLALGVGIVGRVVPLLPTTPFVLLAAACFSIGNKKIFEWLRRTPFFGSHIENYRTKQGISKSLKAVSILILWVGLISSMIAIQTTWIYILLGVVGLGVTIHLLLIKTKNKS